MKRLLLIAAPTVMIAACTPVQSPPKSVGMPNPASKYCVDSGGRSEIRKAADGAEYGVCILPDGRTVDEWTLFRSAHPSS
ncbi:DUF333 domain-containing protein [Brevundimonas sp. SORGH_AS_0993]|uniref:putative hemolysin n=1 Tax=Brevundimonas sp. SORGH_AS_0993 TaxID=3041794 RepID=UPI002789DB54|nr:DUF333 domain-containing protein [Brevundimonas sp. SORGH_AS_0993]MDQ1152857.1 putative hemolysin [Brevundimonas sp. SORGH_AS_0993]